MAAESYAKEGDYDNAITQLSSFITAYEAHAIHRREVGAALVWLGIVYDQVGQEALALEQFERVLSVNYNEAERFGSEDFHKMASRWVMESHLQDGDTEGMKLFLEFLQEAYPHSPETRQAERIYKLFLFHHQNS
jgi:tetratricopeptide (TPR) repeat protein